MIPYRLGNRLAGAAQTFSNAWTGLKADGWVSTWDRACEFILRRWALATSESPVVASDAVLAGAPCFEDVLAPDVSIVVPVFNQIAYTRRCLRAVSDMGANGLTYEVIVVDDGSVDDTEAWLASVPNLRVVRNEENIGFIASCNRGAAAARGKYLVLLNNDTAVQPRWLDELVGVFDRHPQAGLVGAKLLYPDGRLQEAGCTVYSDGRAGNYGRFDDPRLWKYNFLRRVDYCSGAAIAIPLDLFRELGGFDALYSPAYYEDADLAMRVREAGFEVIFQPASVVVHFEGVTSGTSETSGVKLHQRVNRTRFAERWHRQLRSHPDWGVAPDVACCRGRSVLVMVDQADDLDRNLLDYCRDIGRDGPVTVWVRRGVVEPGVRREFEQSGVALVKGGLGQRWFRRNFGRYAVAIIESGALGAAHLAGLRRRWPDVDVHIGRGSYVPGSSMPR